MTSSPKKTVLSLIEGNHIEAKRAVAESHKQPGGPDTLIMNLTIVNTSRKKKHHLFTFRL